MTSNEMVDKLNFWLWDTKKSVGRALSEILEEAGYMIQPPHNAHKGQVEYYLRDKKRKQMVRIPGDSYLRKYIMPLETELERAGLRLPDLFLSQYMRDPNLPVAHALQQELFDLLYKGGFGIMATAGHSKQVTYSEQIVGPKVFYVPRTGLLAVERDSEPRRNLAEILVR